jgi:hypothetical protein
MSSSLWKLCAEKIGQVLRRNSGITCSWTLKDKVFSSAPRTLRELKERIKESCAQVTRGMLTRVVQNFVLRLRAVRQSQGTHIEHVIHSTTHMWNSNPCLLLWHCFHVNKFAFANALLSWKWQSLTETPCRSWTRSLARAIKCKWGTPIVRQTTDIIKKIFIASSGYGTTRRSNLLNRLTWSRVRELTFNATFSTLFFDSW